MTVNTLEKSTLNIAGVLRQAQFELTETAKIQAKYDAQQETKVSEQLYRLRFLNTIVAPTVQNVVDVIKEEFVIASRIMNAKQLETKVEKKIANTKEDIHEKRLAVISATKENSAYGLKYKKGKVLKTVLFIAAIVVALIDCGIAYTSFRTAGFSTIQALALSASVFLLLILSTVVAVPWIQQSETSNRKNVRAFLVCVSVFAVLAGISYLRAEGLNSVIDLSLVATGVPYSQQQYSLWPLLLVSYGLFVGLFFMHLSFHNHSAEAEIEITSKGGYQDVSVLKQDIKEMEQLICTMQDDLSVQKDEVRILYDKFHKLVQHAIHIGDLAQGVYKRTYTSYSSSVPDFFHTDQHISYDTDIKFYTPEN